MFKEKVEEIADYRNKRTTKCEEILTSKEQKQIMYCQYNQLRQQSAKLKIQKNKMHNKKEQKELAFKLEVQKITK